MAHTIFYDYFGEFFFQVDLVREANRLSAALLEKGTPTSLHVTDSLK